MTQISGSHSIQHDEAPIQIPTPDPAPPPHKGSHENEYSDSEESEDFDSDSGEGFGGFSSSGSPFGPNTSFFRGATDCHVSNCTFTNLDIRGSATIVSNSTTFYPPNKPRNASRAAHTSNGSDGRTSARQRGPTNQDPVGKEPFSTKWARGSKNTEPADNTTGTRENANISSKSKRRAGKSSYTPRTTSRTGRGPTNGLALGEGASNFVINGGSFTATSGGNGINFCSYDTGSQVQGQWTGGSSTGGASSSGNTGPSTRRRHKHTNRSSESRVYNDAERGNNPFAPFGGDSNGNGASGFEMNGFTIVNGCVVGQGNTTHLR